MRSRAALIALAAIAVLLALVWLFRGMTSGGKSLPVKTNTAESPTQHSDSAKAKAESEPTKIYAHNLILQKGPDFRVYIRWLRGIMSRAHREVNPSFDEPESFFLDIQNGVLRANIGDISNVLNASTLAHSQLRNISLSGNGSELKLKGTLHKGVPLPIEMTGTLSVAPGNKINVHVTKLSMLKVPVKGLLTGFRLTLQDLFQPKDIQGMQVSDNDILLDPRQLLPPPYIRGQLTAVRIANPDLEEVFGDTEQDLARVEQWRNFLRLRDGTINFGKLTMHHTDIIMIDISGDAWFNLDLIHYQNQLVNGYTRLTPEAGLQIFMPDFDRLPTKSRNVSITWMKNRNISPPADVINK